MLGLGIVIRFPLKLTEPHKCLVRTNMDGARVLVVDEVSALTPIMLVALDEVLRQVYDRDKPFGGISIILTGDFDQKLQQSISC